MSTDATVGRKIYNEHCTLSVLYLKAMFMYCVSIDKHTIGTMWIKHSRDCKATPSGAVNTCPVGALKRWICSVADKVPASMLLAPEHVIFCRNRFNQSLMLARAFCKVLTNRGGLSVFVCQRTTASQKGY